jgi:hypothetical protein
MLPLVEFAEWAHSEADRKALARRGYAQQKPSIE